LHPPTKDKYIFITSPIQSQLNQIMVATNGAGGCNLGSPVITQDNIIKCKFNKQCSNYFSISIWNKKSQALKPTISPDLNPRLPGILADEVAKQLVTNYRSILEGTAQ
jgi:hypothetical protein